MELKTVLIGFYQSKENAQQVLKKLDRHRIHHTTALHKGANSEVTQLQPFFHLRSWVIALLTFFILGDLVILTAALAHQYLALAITFFAVTLLFFAGLLIYMLVFAKNHRVDPLSVRRFNQLLMNNETLLIVECSPMETKKVLEIMKEIKNDPPVIFVYSPIEKNMTTSQTDLLPQKPFNTEHLQEQAEKLSKRLTTGPSNTSSNKTLINKLNCSEKNLSQIYDCLNFATPVEHNVLLSAEWLLDNAYIIQGQIKDVRLNLPADFYKELPLANRDPWKDLPRAYVLAQRLVMMTDGRITRENIVSFLEAYQNLSPLTMGELWAFPLLLRLVLFESIEQLATNVIIRHRESQLAEFWANRLLNAVRRDPEKLYSFLSILTQFVPSPSTHFANELIEHLCDEELALTPIKKWLERKLGNDLVFILQTEQGLQTLEQTSLSNAITSLHRLSQIDWRILFEEVSVVHCILSKEASQVYSKMDFSTRDSYRHALEKITKEAHFDEIEAAHRLVGLTFKAHDELGQHIGYYLLDEGLPFFMEKLNIKLSWSNAIRNLAKHYASEIYIGSICALTLGVAFSFGYLAHTQKALPSVFWFFSIISLIPSSEIAIQLINYLIARNLKPQILPKMSYEKGIPDECKTLVAVPNLLTNIQAIKEDIENLEIRYLANIDSNLVFCLISDHCDSLQKENETDKPLLDFAIVEIQKLNEKYPDRPFFLFHRPRVWCHSEQLWMGKERKRGKIELLNRFLVGDNASEVDEFLHVGHVEHLRGVRFVIALDADTQLLSNRARSLIETITHPLNQPIVNGQGQIERGYSIIQPRVSTSFPSGNGSFFAKIFSDPTGSDPYTKAISDIYQDIFHEGVYHGKGIYDLYAFHGILSQKFPDDLILSHDLLEGSHVGVGFASDIELLDNFPSTYVEYCKRAERWIRGDWQISGWMFPKVPGKKKGKIPNQLGSINRWKIFDNLRRSLLAPSLFFLLIANWFLSPSASWSTLALIVIAIPAIIQLIEVLRVPLKDWSGARNDIKKCLARIFFSATLLPHQTFLNLQAISKGLWRKFITRKKLLEWEPSSFSAVKKHIYYQIFQWQTIFVALVSLGVLSSLIYFSFPLIPSSIIFLTLWVLSPLTIQKLNLKGLPEKKEILKEMDVQFLKEVARKTWRYFDDFVNVQTNWLPPDNYQENLRVEVAKRTSSTNIGLYFTSIQASYSLGFITLDNVIKRVSMTLKTLDKLERYEGHLLNWYDIETLQPLTPKYVSTVDSGNMLGALWTLDQGLLTYRHQHILSHQALDGLATTLKILHDSIHKHHSPVSNILYMLYDKMHDRIKETGHEVNEIYATMLFVQKTLIEFFDILHKNVARIDPPIVYWAQQAEHQVKEWLETIHTYLPWLSESYAFLFEKLKTLYPQEAKLLFSSSPTMIQLAENTFSPLEKIKATLKDKEKSLFLECQKNAVELVKQLDNLIGQSEKLGNSMNMRFLYNSDRKLFSIGYSVSEHRLDTSFYDLLASEARLASLIAIARREVSESHWWALGRPFGLSLGRTVLRSWGGTMFEFLMPVIYTKNFENSLLDHACKDAVLCQIDYGKKRNIPWGISESAYSGLDIHKIYQYRAFGVPGLGLKRGLENDLVVTPYSTGLALMIKPLESLKNFHRLRSEESMTGQYGYYEAIDFSRRHSPRGKRGVIIYAYMAHHQGMTLTGIANTLCANVFQGLFHSHPRIKAVESLLYERPLTTNLRYEGHTQELPLPKLTPLVQSPITGVIDSPNTPYPHTHLLSNGKYTVMLTNSGGGYSQFENNDITRWRADFTRDNWGAFFYIKDLEKQVVFSTTFHPIDIYPKQYSVNFLTDKAEYKRSELGLEIRTEVAVSPEDNAEIRTMTIANFSLRARYLEITSYSELVLAPHAADLGHPAFNKMFIETEAIPALEGLIAFRRLRKPDETPLYAMHIASFKGDEKEPFQFETSKENFIGRGNTTGNPQALKATLSNSQGFVLDPIFSLRKKITIEPGKRVKLSFVTGAARSREEVIHLMEKYSDYNQSARALEMAWTHSEITLRHLHITHDQAKIFQQLASRLIYPFSQLRASAERLRKNQLGQSRLWSYGISGDLPIVVATINNSYDIDILQQILIAHTYWNLHGLKCDLLILNEQQSGYEQTLQEQLQRLIQGYSQYAGVNKPGGIYTRSSDQIPEDDLNLLFTVAHIVLNTSRGNLRQQLVTPFSSATLPPPIVYNSTIREEPSPPLPFLQLLHFNGMGGFTTDGKEYAVYMGAGMNTPAPWINVVANPNFGFTASERGLGTTWFGNSQSNRLSPWSNDPTVDPISDIIYLRDNDSGIFWTMTPGTIRELDPYRTRHGLGYSVYEHNSHAIEQEMIAYVPVESGEPIRIQKIRLKNFSSRYRRLSIIPYVELVLGSEKEQTQRYIITQWDVEARAIFATNAYHPDFPNRVTFLASSIIPISYTGDRTEFIGRNGALSAPAALKRQRLSNMTGAALDPCTALQINLELHSQEEIEFFLFFGQAENHREARQLIQKYRDLKDARLIFQQVQQTWQNLLSKIQVQTPDSATDLMFNNWLMYQNLSCRIWGRTGFYQSSGAYGFRDQLQDVTSLVYFDAELTKQQILRTAARQYLEGDVQHWWHPQSGAGVRTKITDDLLWLPLVTAHYIKVTGDHAILDQEIPFLEGRVLEENEHEIFLVPNVSSQKATLYQHCLKAIHKSLHFGPHQLPLIGGGDWNDGMNLVGVEDKGESVWLAWFMIDVLKNFIPIISSKQDSQLVESYQKLVQDLREAIEDNAWDGNWYLRAFYDNGATIGSHKNDEARIDSIPQSWSIISGEHNTERSMRAMEAVEKYLVDTTLKIILLFTPPFDKTPENPGYIKGYPPGVRENGGQYTHAACWVTYAYARLKNGDRAVNLLKMINPINHSNSEAEMRKYKVEPYVVAADIYSLKGHGGRGGWTWYTGSASWMYRSWLEEVFGFKLKEKILRMDPVIPKDWETFTLRYRYQTTLYEISIFNPEHVNHGVKKVEVDGKEIPEKEILLQNDNQTHKVSIWLGS